ncbi:hypothetical protein PVAND_005070 [Polypedilum vanderplanki]|uniref:Peptidase C50 domain-containing protein n=1 Tax=Polypedilum vanderplanki TaxID=319348 RepID=A0A9J6C0X9_POLVA|nr:hypothetical protein PVAND_005070 [Polypedilum vanderplanki]
MPRNRTTSDSHQPILQDTDCYTSESTIINIPAIKQIFLQRAWEFIQQRNEKYAIFYQTISFCLTSTTSQQQQFCDKNENNDAISSYVEKIIKELNYDNNSSIDNPSLYYSNEDINKYLEKEISSTCRSSFPKEWTVIQLSKNFNPYVLSSKHEEIMCYNTGISMTIFKHSAVKDMMLLEIKKQLQLENLFEKSYKLPRKITDSISFTKFANIASESEKQEYMEKYVRDKKDIENYVQEVINLLTLFIGPWICVLTGNFKSRKSIETENEIRKKIYEFVSKRNYTEYQEKLIHLIARRTDLLTHQQIFVAITYILRDKSNLGYNDVDLNDLYDYLTWIKQEYKYDDVSTHPCILIIDELLDHMPFEMINTQQEYTRVCSFSNLKRLWSNHRNSMDNSGNIITTLNKCQAIVNPDGSLREMEDRLKNFYNYWLPSFKLSCNSPISKESFHEYLTQNDVLVYSGHGSGINYSITNMYHLKSKAIVFLFGCGSTSLFSTGLNSEMKGAHIYYHIGNAPTVIGFLYTVSDFPTDLCTTKILSSWIRTSAKPHWQLIDRTQWKKNGNLAFTRVCEVFSSDSLTEVITKMHSDTELPLSLRASLVYRGLPVVASSK